MWSLATLLCVPLLLGRVSAIWTETYDRQWTQRLSVDNGGQWGEWHKPRFCADRSYAYGFELKVQDEQGVGDDSALNAISLLCTDDRAEFYGGSAQSHLGAWGDWRTERTCIMAGEEEDNPMPMPARQMFLTRFMLQVEPPRGLGDDTAANDITFTCREWNSDDTRYELVGNGGPWGSYGGWSAECPLGQAICGLQTKIEGCAGDITALNDVAFYCCQ